MQNQAKETVDEQHIDDADDRELTPEELDQVSGGSGAAKRNAYNAAQQPWQATI